MLLAEIKKEEQNKMNALINDCGVFFAFSTEQFHKNKTPLKEGEKYVNLKIGGYIPKFSLDTFLDGLKSIKKWYREETTKCKQIRIDLIIYELYNHEAFYIGDIQDTLKALGKGYSRKEVLKVYYSELKKQID